MMNFTLFKADCKNNAVIFVIVMYVMMMYFSFVTYMFDPTDTSAFQGMVDLLPEGLMAVSYTHLLKSMTVKSSESRCMVWQN